MTEPGPILSGVGALQEQVDSLQLKGLEPDSLLQNEEESAQRDCLEEVIYSSEEMQTSIQQKLQRADPRRCGRERKPTEKMVIFQKEEALRKEKRLNYLYEQWKIQAREVREQLKTDITESQLSVLIDELEKRKGDVIAIYVAIRNNITPSSDLRRRVDACEAVTADITKIAYERLAGIDGEFSAEREKCRLRQLLHHEYARSIYGSTVSRVSKRSSNDSATSCMAAKRADAAAELAAKEAEFTVMMEEKRQQERIRQIEEHQRRELETHKCELERLKAEKGLRAARARLEVYNHEAAMEASILPIDYSITEQRHIPAPVTCQSFKEETSPHENTNSFVQALQNSITLNRLPVPEPSIFSGDPLHFIEWKASFVLLIDGKNVSSAHKLYYLKKYIAGPARKILDGIFYRSDDEAYQDAWNKLNHRYGQPFVIQRAFREKLANWPKIQLKDAIGLRDYSDFLNACQDAMPHVKGLQILNDCEENRKLVQKLPDWVASQWNRQVTLTLKETQEFPGFKEFAAFLSTEAEIACNPITSLTALHASEQKGEKQNLRETKRNMASVLNTQSVRENSQSLTKISIGSQCMFCSDDGHQLHSCLGMMSKPLDERRKFVQERKLCYGCLMPGHNVKDCCRRHSCDLCKKRHPTCLHDSSYVPRARTSTFETSNEVNSNETTTAVALTVTEGRHSASTSMVVPVWVSSCSRPDAEKLVYALLDTQSDTTFVDQGISDALGADTFPVKLKLSTMIGRDTLVKSERVFGLRVRGYNSQLYIELPSAYTKECIPLNRSHVPTCETAQQWKHLSEIANEIPPLLDCEAGLLIGYNCSRALMPRQVIEGENEEPYAVCTDLGWSIVGPSSPHMDSSNNIRLCYRVTVKELPLMTPADAIHVLESDFKDTNEEEKRVSQDDILFLRKLQEGIKKNSLNHYEMPLPFKKRPSLPNNESLAIIRLDHLKRKLQRNDKYKEHYVSFMEDIIEKGDAEEVKDEGNEGETWYIPHHGIYHPKKPNKLRIVFDCSAKYKGTCLNDHLLTGPDLMNSLVGVLIRFRQHSVALMCDVEKMFHQFHVCEPDRNYLRFLWWKKGNLHTDPQRFRMKVHLFGAASSPGCANYGLKHLAKMNSVLYPLSSQFILRNFYVDDGITSVNSTEQGIKLARETQELCAKGGLRLHKFVSNNTTVLDSIPPSERASDVKNFSLTFDDLPIERALGIQWHIESDCFKFNFSLKGQPATRRGILSTIASLYDPLGFVAPFIFNGKRVLQEMCRKGISWDDTLHDELQPRWELWKNDLINLKHVSIPRSYVPASFGKVVQVELHHFSDASICGYGQSSYLRLKNEIGEVHCTLVMGKSRVSPTKVTTIPRLELMAAVISVKISSLLKNELEYSDIDEFFWTDSKVVLGYINNEARRFHTFVANRVQRIHLSTTTQQWRYVPTTENPADHASRGLTVCELLSSNWFTGPKFLWERELPSHSDMIPELSIGDPEVRVSQVLTTTVTEQKSLIDRLISFSSWSRAVQAVARILRRIQKNKSDGISTVIERQNAKSLIIKTLQKQVYRNELKILKTGVPLPSHNSLFSLDAFIDKDGVLKVGGRLSSSSLPDSLKHPTILPKNHHITTLIVGHCHERIKHQGKGLTINEIRSNGFWIPSISRVVKRYIQQCIICRKHRRPIEEQRMADLPPERVDPSPPFTYCGMDCFGPFLTKEGRKVNKRYGLLFTCFCSRAIHIEMLDDMSTDAFINGLRCFIAIRGAVCQIKSDQGSNFLGAKNELKEALKEVDNERIMAFLAERQCDFNMNAPYSSHVGGVWERQIKTVKSVLNITLSLSSGRLDDSSLRTFLYEAMSIVNSRPLTTDNLNDPSSLEPLTPNHLLTLKSTAAVPPPGKFVKEDMYARKRWRHVQYLAEQFWSRWRKEYIFNIALRQRWHIPRRNLQIGDIVIMKEDDLPRTEWRLGRIVETKTDKDGLVRRVKIHLGDQKLGKKGERLSKPSVVERPIQKLVLLLETS